MIQERICKTCGRSFQGGPRAYYCIACRTERQKSRDRDRKKNGPNRPLGSTDKCEKCGKDYIVNAGLQRFCPECRPEHTLEYDRYTSIDFYRKNSDTINAVRNPRRRKKRNCEWCGKEYEAVTRTNTCSAECRRKLRNKKWNEHDKKRRGGNI